ncbi:MAG: FecR domain-containing protein [Pseudomonadota bacterium]
MMGQNEDEVLERAVQLFLRLRDRPDDHAILAERDAFLARGPAERAAYEKAQNAWRATSHPRRGGPLKLILLIAAAGAGAMLLAEPIRIATLADLSTNREPEGARLASGDAVTLDADSALVDESGDGNRDVQLLRGAAYFEVAPDGRPFLVSVDDVEIEVLGTAFEVAVIEDEVAVTVGEGEVEVRTDGASRQLEAGDRLTRTDDGALSVTEVDPDDVATWRRGQLIVDGMTVAQVAAVIDRRLPGQIVILDSALAEARVAGTFDLENPLNALRTLAAIHGATVYAAPPLMTVMFPQDF